MTQTMTNTDVVRRGYQAFNEADGGRVVGLHHSSGVRNGKRLDTDACIVFELENGRIISGREYVYDLQNSDEFWS